MGRFLNLVVEYKHKIGFKGTILIEPKPQEPPSTSTTTTSRPSTASSRTTVSRRK